MKYSARLGALSLLLLVMAGCQTAPIPPVDATLARIGKTQGVTADSLANGRAVLTSRCIRCHGLGPVADHSLDQWRQIVRKMAPRARLDCQQEADLLAFLCAAREL